MHRRPYLASLDQVRITRDGELAVIIYDEPGIAPVQLWIGPRIHDMSDQEILDQHNIILALESMKDTGWIPVEIPDGHPQLEYCERSGTFISRGEVLRCLIDDMDEEVIIRIDDRELSLEEFGRLLATYAGWGMRITFVPEDQTQLLHEVMLWNPPSGEDEDEEMPGEIIKMPMIADPSIDQVLDEFIEEQRNRFKTATVSKYERVIGLLRKHLNDCAYQGLDTPDRVLFERHCSAEGEQRLDFCQIFGPEMIIYELDRFLGHSIIRKSMVSETLKRAAGTVTKRLSKWLGERGYIEEELAGKGIDKGAGAVQNIPRAERATDRLYTCLYRGELDEIPDDDLLDFDQYTIVRTEPGTLWLEQAWSSDGSLIRVPVPEQVFDLLEEGWEVGCTLARIDGQWRMIQIGNVYPQ
ncbi:MAG: hypothetical protein R6U70_03510 [Bacillota bacterium]